MAKSKYIFSLLIILFITFTSSFSQEQEDDLYAPQEEKEPLKLKGIKLGVNVGRFSDFLFKPERFSYEGSVDFNLNYKYFGVLEAGYSEIFLEENNYTYSSSGMFYKVGMDYNMLKKHPTDYLGMGVRIGLADFKQSAGNVMLEPGNWSVTPVNIDSKSYNTYWVEISFGIKGELLKNVYFGWSALVRIAVAGREDNLFQPYDIPGFGKGANTVNLGANYYIYYQIPFKRKGH